MSGSYDVILVLSPFRDNVCEFRILTRPVADLEAAHMQDVEGFYCPSIDTALLVMRFHRRSVAMLGERMLLAVAGRSGLPMVVPDQLSPRDRQAFFLEHLTRYTTYVQQYPSPRENISMVERVIASLSEHIAPESTRAGRPFDPNLELPVINPKRRRRMESAAIV